MKNFIVYIDNGKIVRFGSCQDETFDLQAKENEYVIEGITNGNQYIENGELVDITNSPGDNYIFDYQSKSWVYDTTWAIADALQKRDNLLKDGPDRISPIWWSSMTQEQQSEWSKYRQDLLDITSQPDFPHDIIWPIKPA